MAVERREIVDREEWLGWRREDITASKVGGLFSCHEYESALKLYASHRGVEFPQEDNPTMRRGRWMEPAVIAAVREKRPDWIIEPAKIYLRDPDLRLGATPDAFIGNDPRGPGVLQCKSVAPSVFVREWNDGAECPFWITLQCLTEMMLADAAFGVVAGLTVDPHAMDCHVIEVPRDPASEAKIIAAINKFWIDVREGNEPEPDYGKDSDVIKALNPRETPGKQIDLSGNNELPGLLELRAALMRNIKRNEDQCEAITAQLKHIMGDAEIAIGLRDFGVTYKTQHREKYSVPAKDMRILRITDRRPAADQSP